MVGCVEGSIVGEVACSGVVSKRLSVEGGDD